MTPNLDRFAALDVEIAMRKPLAVCAIGVARFESGCEIAHYQSPVRFTGRVKYAHIHGLTRADLRDAPLWPLVWKSVLTVLGDTEVVVAFRASFDRAAIMTMCARHALPMPRVRFLCAAMVYEAHAGRSADLVSALRALDLPFPGRPHDPLADARAAAAIVLSCCPSKGREQAIQLSKTQAADDPATRR